MSLPSDHIHFEIVAGATQDAPIYQTHKRGKNWMAVIHQDPAQPNGLGRRFIPKARGEGNYYIVEGAIKGGEPVEFGADYYTGGGSKCASRWYGVVVSISDEEIVLVNATTAKRAIKLAEEMRQAVPSIPSVDDLRSRLAELTEKADEIRAQLKELEEKGLIDIDTEGSNNPDS